MISLMKFDSEKVKQNSRKLLDAILFSALYGDLKKDSYWPAIKEAIEESTGLKWEAIRGKV